MCFVDSSHPRPERTGGSDIKVDGAFSRAPEPAHARCARQYHRSQARGADMRMWIVATGIAAAAVAAQPVRAQVAVATPSTTPGNPIALVDSNGNVAARPLNETLMLVALGGGVVAPAVIRAVYDADGRAASALATWHSGGSVLFTSADCTTGAHVYSSASSGRASGIAGEDASGDRALRGGGRADDHDRDSVDSLRHRLCFGRGSAKRPGSGGCDRQPDHRVSAAPRIPVERPPSPRWHHSSVERLRRGRSSRSIPRMRSPRNK